MDDNMKRILVITVLAVLLTSTVGATTAMAAPTQTVLTISAPGSVDAGSSFEVIGTLSDAATGAGVKGQVVTVYQSTDGKKWTAAGTGWTGDGGAYTVPVKQSLPGTYSYKAEFAGDKDLKKATSETTTVEIRSISGSYSAISGIELVNNWGFFVAKIACYYSTDNGNTWKESGHSSGIAQSGVRAVHLADLDVPDGALVKMHAIVVGGKDRTGSEVFQAKHGYPGDWWYADYWITGATWNPTLTYHGIYGNNY